MSTECRAVFLRPGLEGTAGVSGELLEAGLDLRLVAVLDALVEPGDRVRQDGREAALDHLLARRGERDVHVADGAARGGADVGGDFGGAERGRAGELVDLPGVPVRGEHPGGGGGD